MRSPTLAELREHIERLGSPGGPYYLACGRTGERPVPAVGMRFGNRTTARAAARAVEEYRATLRRYDSRFPYYDVIVREDASAEAETNTAESWSLSQPVVNRPDASRSTLVEFCHRVVAAVFEAVADAGHDAVEAAAMDAYFDLAETVVDPDAFCLRLLERLATELDRHLSTGEQVAVLDAAAERLNRVASTGRPVSETLSSLRAHGLLGQFTQSAQSVDSDAGTRSVVVELSDYALSPQRGRLPVLPLVLDLYRRRPDRPPASLRAVEDGDGWEVTVVLSRTAEPTNLVSAPIEVSA
ncbi:DUF7551 domain-containing protein [Haloplanus sp. C73]|uniref:DUF7551 domain-containing protein n=1 Tax=Haloplanus sp. C73 TaxID=3421641 RepID=UPI003EB6E88E